MSRRLIQALLNVLRVWFNIDLYKIYVRSKQFAMWNKAFPSNGNLSVDGVCLAYDLGAITSYSQVGRDFSLKMLQSRLGFQLFNIGNPKTGESLSVVEKKLVQCYSDTTIKYKNILLFAVSPWARHKKFNMALCFFWEFESGLMEQMSSVFEGISHVVAFSDFCYEYLSKTLSPRISVHKVRYPFQCPDCSGADKVKIRERYGINEGDFVVFYNFSFGSCMERKNPMACVDAFALAFKGESRCKLVFKTTCFNECPEKVDALRRHISKMGIELSVVLINEHLSYDDVIALTASANVYLSLHRGEGLGLGMLEAMSVGTPVICSDYGGSREFAKPETAFLVPCKMIKAETDFPFYKSVELWADADVGCAADFLKIVRDRPDIVSCKTQAAQKFVKEHYSCKWFERDVQKLVEEMNRRCGDGS